MSYSLNQEGLRLNYVKIVVAHWHEVYDFLL